MSQKNENHKKIIQLLSHKNKCNIDLALQFIRGCEEEETIRNIFLEKIYISDLTFVRLAIVFQGRPLFWQKVANRIEGYNHGKDIINRWIPRFIIAEDIHPTPQYFCDLLNPKTQKIYPSFPLLDPSILKEVSSSTWHSER